SWPSRDGARPGGAVYSPAPPPRTDPADGRSTRHSPQHERRRRSESPALPEAFSCAQGPHSVAISLALVNARPLACPCCGSPYPLGFLRQSPTSLSNTAAASNCSRHKELKYRCTLHTSVRHRGLQLHFSPHGSSDAR